MDRHREEQHAGGSRLQKKEKKQKVPKEKKKSRLTRQQKILIVIAVLLAIVLAVVVACQSLFVRPDLENKKPEGGEEQETEELDYGDGVRPRSDGERKSEDYYTVLILGRDTGGGGNTDTMLLASYDVTNQKATVMSIPRDTMVNVSWDVKKINSVYNMYGGGEKGIQALYKEIAQLVGFEPDYQVIVEWEAVGEIVDAMGGVYFDVPRDMDYEDPYQDLSIHLDKGYQKLNGEQAMGVVRFRDGVNGYANGDIGRIETQQAFLKAVIEQMLQIQNVTKINQFAKVFQENVTTDLSFQNILWFAQQAIFGGLKVENVNFVTMPYKGVSAWSRSYSQNLSYVVPVADDLLELVNNDLSPFKEVFTLSDLDIMYVNSDGSVGSTTGHVEDAKAAQPPVKPSKPTVTPEEETPAVDENGTSGETGTTTPEGGTTGGETTPPPETGGETGGQTGGETSGGESGGGTSSGETGGGTSGGETTTPPETGGDGSGGTETGTASGETGGTTTDGTQGSGTAGTGGQTTVPTDPGFSVIEPPPAA